MSEDAGYVCSLDEAALRKAKDELYEDPKDRLSAVQALRAWVRDQKHMCCRTDTAYLLMYLRGAKFSQLRARELLNNTLTMMTKAPEWFHNIDTHDPGIQAYLKAGTVLNLPGRDKQNRRVILIRPGAVSPSNKYFSEANKMKATFVSNKVVLEDEMTQVYGYVLLFDYTGFGMKHMKTMSMDNSRKQSKVWQDALPGRVKEFHIYNASKVFESIMALIRPFMKKKFTERIRVHDSIESLCKYIPMEMLPSDYLPDDYKGPHAGTVQQNIDRQIQKVMSPNYRQLCLEMSSPTFGIDKSKMESDIPQASFRKLTID